MPSSSGCEQKYQEKEDLVGADVMRHTERIVMLQVIDNQWKDHLLSMDELKQGIGNRAYGQKDPLVEYKKESYELFTAMMDRIEDETVRFLYFLQVRTDAGPALPFPDEDEEGRRKKPAPRPDPNEQQRQAAKSSMEDFTRNIQRKKEKEMAELQFVGGDGSSGPKPVSAGQEGGPQRPVPLRQRQEVQAVPWGVRGSLVRWRSWPQRKVPAPSRLSPADKNASVTILPLMTSENMRLLSVSLVGTILVMCKWSVFEGGRECRIKTGEQYVNGLWADYSSWFSGVFDAGTDDDFDYVGIKHGSKHGQRYPSSKGDGRNSG